MTLAQFIRAIGRICLQQKNVRTFGQGDLYADMVAPDLKYTVMYVTQNQHQSEENVDRYSINLFYIDRQENIDGDNMLQVQSIGKEVIENVVRIFCETYYAEVYGTIYFQPFIQRWSDLTCGVYAIITLEVPKDSLCID